MEKDYSTVPNESISTGENKSISQKFSKWREAIFLTSVAGMAMLFGFGASISSAKKQDPDGFDKGMTPSSRRFEGGAALATRALKWGTFYAFTGCGVVCLAIWKLSGAKDLKEFRQKAGAILPRIPKNEPQGRTEFANLTDLLQYVIDEDNRTKAEKAKLSLSSGPNSSQTTGADVVEGGGSAIDNNENN